MIFPLSAVFKNTIYGYSMLSPGWTLDLLSLFFLCSCWLVPAHSPLPSCSTSGDHMDFLFPWQSLMLGSTCEWDFEVFVLVWLPYTLSGPSMLLETMRLPSFKQLHDSPLYISTTFLLFIHLLVVYDASTSEL